MTHSEKPLSRMAEATVSDALESSPVVVLLGPARCGKTTLLKKFAAAPNTESVPVSYEQIPWNKAFGKTLKLARFLAANRSKRICIDDVQFIVKFSRIINREIEEDARPGRFLLTSQDSRRFRKELDKLPAGAVKIVRLGTLCVPEVGNRAPLETQWLRGGFPESLFAESDARSLEWRRGYPEAFLARHWCFPSLYISPEKLRLFMETLLSFDGGTIVLTVLEEKAGIGQKTIADYLNTLDWTGIIRRLPANSFGLKKNYHKNPKIFFRDSGLQNELLGIETFEQLRNHESFGLSWRVFAMENIIACMPGWSPSYFLTGNRTGVDLILERDGRRKLFWFRTDEGPEPMPSYERFARDFTDEPATIITPPNDRYPESYPICRTIRVLTLPAFCKEALENPAE